MGTHHLSLVFKKKEREGQIDRQVDRKNKKKFFLNKIKSSFG